ncbi:MAG: HPr family phosphocarrier protein [Pseudomonadota bacterium]|nr:HPr family phosphocarrier protein [Pseudomonadota bacterium]
MTYKLIRIDKIILNEKGLHARASAKFVALVDKFDADCSISANGQTVAGDSIMGILMLAATQGSTIRLKIWGRDRVSLKKALIDLIDNRFGE